MDQQVREIDIRRLKKFATESLPPNHPLQAVLIAEDDHINVTSFLERLKIWLQLSTIK
jgi:hypothetical protein